MGNLSISSELDRAVRGMLAKYADASKNPEADEDGIEILLGTGEYAGNMLVRIITWDNIDLKMQIWLPDLVKHGREYLGDWEQDIITKLMNQRQSRVSTGLIHTIDGVK